MNERQKNILELLNKSQELSVNELAEVFGVSNVTIRGDLDYLENERLLKRVHGGARLQSEDDIAQRIGINYPKKSAIAVKAATLVSPGETIFIDAGSVNALFARELAQQSDIKVVTSNVFIARQLKEARVNVIILGGVFQHDSESVVGSLAKIGLEKVNFSKAFIGVDGITKSHGFASNDMMRAEIAREAILKAKQAFVLSDSTKIGKIAACTICNLNEIDVLVTDDGATTEQRKNFKEAGIRVEIAETNKSIS
ncbi:MAG: DeoR family transcriptional regulator [Spirochaetota bacterium]